MFLLNQLDLFFDLEQEEEKLLITNCLHENGFQSNGVPSGYFCTDCNIVAWRNLPPPIDQPFLIGYISSSWSWHYEKGLPWTNDDD